MHNTPSSELREQLENLASDCEIAAVKIGMLGNRGNAVVVSDFLDAHKFAHVVHDPVMKSSSGTELLDSGGIKYIMAELLKRSNVITPNVPEAEILSGVLIKDLANMEDAARKIVELGARAVIVRAGIWNEPSTWCLTGRRWCRCLGEKLAHGELHGTGCTFASALAAHLAAGRSLVEAATLAKRTSPKRLRRRTRWARDGCRWIIFTGRRLNHWRAGRMSCRRMGCIRRIWALAFVGICIRFGRARLSVAP